jgi:hypothetical protein
MAAAVYRRVTGATAPTTVDAAPPADAVVPNPAYPG